MGKGGGKVDTSGLEQATREATALQQQMFDLTREDVQPYYQFGTGSLGKLSDLLGISGGSVQNRQSIYDELLPQYTTTQGTGGTQQGLYVDPLTGEVINAQGVLSRETVNDNRRGMPLAMLLGQLNASGADTDAINTDINDVIMGLGYDPAGGFGGSQSVTDYEGLNAAVDARMAEQGTPEGYGSLLESFSLDKFQEDPGYQYRLSESQKALERQMAAQGVTLGGAGFGQINPTAYRAMDELTQGLASQEYGNAYNRYNQDRGMIYDMLMGGAGLGQGALGIQAGAGQNYANNVGNLTTGLASAQVNAQQAANAQRSSMFGSLLGLGASLINPALGAAASGAQTAGINAGLAALSDRRMKENIKHLGQEDGFDMYEFNYIGEPQTYKGVMAQDILLTHPDAVVSIDGVLHVDYDRLGIKMEAV